MESLLLKHTAFSHIYVASPVPESVSVVPTPSEGTLRVTWTRPTVSGGSNITSYSIQYKRSNELTYTSKAVNGGDTTSSDITGLDLSTQYSVRIASVNELGTGNYSGIVRATTYGCTYVGSIRLFIAYYTYLIHMCTTLYWIISKLYINYYNACNYLSMHHVHNYVHTTLNI